MQQACLAFRDATPVARILESYTPHPRSIQFMVGQSITGTSAIAAHFHQRTAVARTSAAAAAPTLLTPLASAQAAAVPTDQASLE